jgi:hypothetical protein
MVTTPQEHNNNLVVNAYYREKELYSYQVNIDNYTIMLTGLPTTDWPENLVQYKNTLTENLPWDMSDSDIDTVTQLQYRDRLRTLVRTEKVEQNKVRLVIESLKAQIVAAGGNYEELLDAKKVEEDAKVASA